MHVLQIPRLTGKQLTPQYCSFVNPPTHGHHSPDPYGANLQRLNPASTHVPAFLQKPLLLFGFDSSGTACFRCYLCIFGPRLQRGLLNRFLRYGQVIIRRRTAELNNDSSSVQLTASKSRHHFEDVMFCNVQNIVIRKVLYDFNARSQTPRLQLRYTTRTCYGL